VRVLRVEALERYFAGTAHVEPSWFYAKVMAIGFFPWIAPLLLGYARMWRERGEPGSRTARYTGAAFLAGLAFLSVGRSKIPSYVLPLAPLASIVVVWELGREIAEAGRRRAGPLLLAGLVAVLGLLVAIAIRLVEPEMRGTATAGAAALLAGGLCALALAWRHRVRGAWAAAVLAMAGFFLVGVVGLFPVIANRKSAAGLVAAVPGLRGARPVATVDMNVPSLTFYLDRPVEVVAMRDLVARLGRSDDPALVLDRADLPAVPIEARDLLREIGGAGKYLAFEKRREEGPRPP
jgi:hypothetical protein